MGAVPLERLLADQHFIQDDAEPVDVGPSVQWLAFRLFRAEVIGAAQRGVVQCQPDVLVQLLGDSEIGEYRGSILAKQDVRRLDIAVDDAPAMQEIEAIANDLHQFERRLGAHSRADALLQVAVLEVFHGNIVPLADDADIVDGDDVAVIQRGDDPAFVAEAAGLNGVVDILEQLEGYLPLQGFLYRQVDGRHATFGDGSHDLVARYPRIHGLAVQRRAVAGRQRLPGITAGLHLAVPSGLPARQEARRECGRCPGQAAKEIVQARR